MRVDLQARGCRYCGEIDNELEFSLEFDAYVHLRCIVKAWEEHPRDDEVRIMAREFGLITEIRADELNRLRKRVADLEAGLQWALNEGGWRLWYHALDHGRQPPPVIEVPKRVGEVARVRPMEEVV